MGAGGLSVGRLVAQRGKRQRLAQSADDLFGGEIAGGARVERVLDVGAEEVG